MKYVLIFFGTLSVIAGASVLVLGAHNTSNSTYELEALLLGLIATVFFTGAAVIETVEKIRPTT
jgi:hypothetical protein